MSSHLLLEGIDLSQAPKGSYLIEVGSVREMSVMPSSLYLSRKAKDYGLNFLTVDFWEESWKLAQSYVGDQAILGDGAEFLRRFPGRIAVLYLDNFDFPPHNTKIARELEERAGHIYAAKQETLTRGRSSQVHLEQYLVALAKMSVPSWLILDDTIREQKFLRRLCAPFRGKGERIVSQAIEDGFVIMKEGHRGILFFKSGQKYSLPLKWLQRYCGTPRAKPLYELLGHPGFSCR